MEILTFVVVIVALILVHEFGHFVAAKWSGMRVDEFGIGYPPRLWGFRRGETEYTLNALPFGGFVRICGEDNAVADARAFATKSRAVQAFVLISGVLMNILLAWVLFSLTLAIGTPRVLSAEELTRAADASLTVAAVLPASPAAVAGLKAGDVIAEAVTGETTFASPDPAAFTVFVESDTSRLPIRLSIVRDGATRALSVTPAAGVISADLSRPALGISVIGVGTLPVSLAEAPIEGARLTLRVVEQTAIGLGSFFSSVATFSADFSAVSGPIGIAGAVGSAAKDGAVALLTLTAIISVNLALINLVPVPALDGGRLLFVLVESVIRRPIRPSIARAANTAGFALLIFLMLAVSFHDIVRAAGA